jgi:hypothetical protein
MQLLPLTLAFSNNNLKRIMLKHGFLKLKIEFKVSFPLKVKGIIILIFR